MKEKELLDTKQAFAQCVVEGITVMIEEDTFANNNKSKNLRSAALRVSCLFATGLILLSVRSVTTLPVTPRAHHVDLVPMSRPFRAIFSNSNMTKAQL